MFLNEWQRIFGLSVDKSVRMLNRDLIDDFHQFAPSLGLNSTQSVWLDRCNKKSAGTNGNQKKVISA